MSLTVSCRSHSADPSSITEPVGVKICSGHSITETGVSPRTSVSPCHYRSTNALYSSSFTRGPYQRQTGDGLSEIDKH